MRLAVTILLVALPALSGCVAYEIRDELRTTNFRLSQVETQLEELQRTNQRLEVVRQQLRILEHIQISLANLDEHLSSVRVIISSMNSMMSLFDFSSKEDEALEGETPGEPAHDDPDNPNNEAPADAAPQLEEPRTSESP